MTTQYSTSLRLALIGDGDQAGTWGDTTNYNFGTLVEEALTGVVAISLTGLTTYTLKSYNGTYDDARSMVLIFAGSPTATVTITAPLVNKFYVVVNNTSQTITMSASGGSQSLNIPANVTAQCYCDASNVSGNGAGFYSAQTGSAGNFFVNGTLTASGESDTGNLSVGGNLSVTGTTTLTGTATAPTVTSTDSSTNIATTAFVKSVTGTLGTMSTQNANAVAITGGTMSGVTVSGGNAITTSNIGSQSVSFATTAGNGGVTSVNGNTGTVTVVSIGVGQTWVDVTSSRSFGTTYTNSTGKPIMVSTTSYSTYNPSAAGYVGGVLVAYSSPNTNGGNNAYAGVTFIVPAGATYYVNGNNMQFWSELR